MAQFDVYRRTDGYLLDCQSDLLDRFDSRVVVPLVPAIGLPREFLRLMPVFDVGGLSLLMATHLASAVSVRELGTKVGSLAAHHYEIQGAIDMLIGGY